MATSLVLVGFIILSAVLVLTAGLRAIRRDKTSTASFLFFLSTLGASVWLGCLAMILLSRDAAAATAWGRASYVGVLLIPVSLLHFTTSLCSPGQRHTRFITAVWITTPFLMVLAIGTSLFITGVFQYPWGYYTKLSPVGVGLAIWSLVLLGTALAMLIREYRRHTEASVREGLRLLIAAFAIGDIGLIDFLPSLGLDVRPVGFLGIAGFSIITSYGLRTSRLSRLTPSYAAAHILATMHGGVLVTDLDGRIRVANAAASDLLRYSERELLELSISDIIETPFNLGRASDTLTRGDTIRDRPMLWRTSDARIIEMGVSASLLRDDQNLPSGVVYVATDISERERARQIEYQAFHDALTGLPNRAYLRRRIDEEIANDHSDLVPALVFIDLDGFKVVNDYLGHSAGDSLLQTISRRLKDAVRSEDLVCRLGGDEFVVMMRISSPKHAIEVGTKLLDAIQEHLVINGETVQVSGSVGVALYPTHGSDSEALLKNADSAMYAAKEAGKNQVVVCGPHIAERANRRFRIESALRKAVANEELELFYQPIVDLRSDMVAGAEALLRWPRDGRLVPPGDFLPVAEETGLIREMGEWALFMACREVNTWLPLADRSLRIAVNISAEQLRDGSITEAVSSALSLNGINPSNLVLEVTESAAMRNVEQSARIMNELRDVGVQLAIDDFGTGYSSLSYLQQFPIDLLKIDRSFVWQLGRRRSSGAIVSATIALAKALELEVVAEGVETRYQLATLRLERCRYAQGFAFGRPMTSAEFRAFVHRWEPRHSEISDIPAESRALLLPTRERLN